MAEKIYVVCDSEDDTPADVNTRYQMMDLVDEIRENVNAYEGYFVYELVPVKRFVVKTPNEVPSFLVPVSKKKGKK